jgi:acrylyl-CoA reductase (NADPH)
VSRRYRALLAAEPDGTPARLVERSSDELDEGDVTVEVGWSSLNYKDALAVTGNAPVVRRFPLVCGIDLAGRVISSTTPELSKGTIVVATGCGLGEEHDGGFAELARLHAHWCVPLASRDEARWAATIGTAGFTAMLAVLALERLGVLSSAQGAPVLVTGAAGGVGSFAVALLAKRGLEVVALTGRLGEADYLNHLGATQVISRDEFLSEPRRPLARERYAGAVDVAGGEVLARVLAQIRAGGAVAACGMAAGGVLETTVYPFILRGTTLAGINSVWPPSSLRMEAWRRLRSELPASLVEEIGTTIGLDEVIARAPDVLGGRVRGRLVVRVGPEV